MYQNKRTALTDFTEISGGLHLDNTSFSDLYYWHYFDRTAVLKKEIMDNLNSLPPTRFDAYMKYVKNEIHEVYGYYNPDECLIGKWIEKFDLKEEDFPFYDNDEVTYLLSVNKENCTSESKKKGVDIKLMQLEFHWYAGHLEYLKMKSFIDELIPKNTDIKASNEEGEKITNTSSRSSLEVNPYPRIFINYKAFVIFDKLKDKFGITDQPLKNYSFVFRKMVKDKLIYPGLKQIEFIEFLAEFDIHIDRINTWNEIGNKRYREGVYSSIR